MYSEDDTLYSYGSHFPLAKYLGKKAGEHLFVKNGDHYSQSTSGHQSITRCICKGPTVSINVLRAAGINFHNLCLLPTDGQPYIVSYRADFTEHVYRDEKAKYWKDMQGYEKPRFRNQFIPPRQGMFVSYNWKDEKNYTAGCWRIIGAILIRHNDEDFLCSKDEGNYFVAKLPVQVSTIDQAFKALKPPEVLRAEQRGAKVLRQGEWFFVPSGLSHKEFAKKANLTKTKLFNLAKVSPLPLRPRDDENEASRNKHCCRQYFLLNEGIYATGNVYHRNTFDNRVTNKHKALKLGEQWYKVCLNTELASWS